MRQRRLAYERKAADMYGGSCQPGHLLGYITPRHACFVWPLMTHLWLCRPHVSASPRHPRHSSPVCRPAFRFRASPVCRLLSYWRDGSQPAQNGMQNGPKHQYPARVGILKLPVRTSVGVSGSQQTSEWGYVTRCLHYGVVGNLNPSW